MSRINKLICYIFGHKWCFHQVITKQPKEELSGIQSAIALKIIYGAVEWYHCSRCGVETEEKKWGVE